MSIELVFWGGLGLICCSFANVLINREGKSTILGRSACPQCGRTLEWYELFPVLSFVFLLARCRTCRARISWQYPTVETLTAVLFLVIGLSSLPLMFRLLGCAIAFFLVAIAVYDLKTTVIPDRWSYSFAALAFVYGAIAFPSGGLGDFSLFAVSGPLVAAPLAFLWLVSHGRWMGLGDAKFMLGAGWLLGIWGGYLALMIAFVSGAFVGVALIGITRLGMMASPLTMKSEVPFGPFLILALCVVWFSAAYDLPLQAVILDFLSLSSWS